MIELWIISEQIWEFLIVKKAEVEIDYRTRRIKIKKRMRKEKKIQKLKFKSKAVLENAELN